MDAKTLNEGVANLNDTEKGYRVKIGRDIFRVVSVFSGTKTASKAIYDAAVKKILYDSTTE